MFFIIQRTRQTIENHQSQSTPYWTSTIVTYSYMVYSILNAIFASNKVLFRKFRNFLQIFLYFYFRWCRARDLLRTTNFSDHGRVWIANFLHAAFTPWKHQKMFGFLVFSGDYKMGTLARNGLTHWANLEQNPIQV